MDASRLLTKNTLPSVPLYTCILLQYSPRNTTAYIRLRRLLGAPIVNLVFSALGSASVSLSVCLSRASDSSLEGLVTGVPRDKGESTT